MNTVNSTIRPQGRFAFWYPFLAAALGFLICRFALIDPIFYNIDEAEYAVAAQALPHGLWPGAELLGSTKPPAIVFLYAGLFAVFGQSLYVVQIASVVLWIVALWLTMKVAARLLPEIPPWTAALTFFLLGNSFGHPRDLQALNVELPGVICILLAFLSLWRGSKQDIFLSGLALGIAVMFRQSFVLYLIPAFIFVTKPLKRSAPLLLAGALTPWLALFAAYGVTGRIGIAMDSWFRYPFVYAGDTGLFGFFQAARYNTFEILRDNPIPWLFAIVGTIALVKRRDVSTLILLTAGVAAIAAGSRFWPHYYIQALSLFAIVAALGAHLLLALGPRWNLTVRTLFTVGCILALLHFPFWRFWDDHAPSNGASPESLEVGSLEIELGRFAREQSSPDERIFVWGYCPQIYFHAQRLPGARDFLCHYTTGYSAGSQNPRQNAMPGAEQMLIEDLRENRPALIFDISAVEFYPYSFLDYPITKYPELAAFVRTNYQPTAQVGSVAVYALIR